MIIKISQYENIPSSTANGLVFKIEASSSGSNESQGTGVFSCRSSVKIISHLVQLVSCPHLFFRMTLQEFTEAALRSCHSPGTMEVAAGV